MPAAAELSFEASRIALLVLAALLGGAVGAQRERHGSPAGLRTHLLVCFGSAMFTIVSATGFLGMVGLPEAGQATAYDPTRIAAQVVAGIGFLGAGAILKEGATIRGLTTAASLWTAAAIGMAVGAGDVILAVAGTAILIVSLGPLGRISVRLSPRAARDLRVRMRVRSPGVLDALTGRLAHEGVSVLGLSSTPLDDHQVQIEATIRLAGRASVAKVMSLIVGADGVEAAESMGHGDEA